MESSDDESMESSDKEPTRRVIGSIIQSYDEQIQSVTHPINFPHNERVDSSDEVSESSNEGSVKFEPAKKVINSPEMYEKFKAGDYDEQYEAFVITYGAHNNILAEAKLFHKNGNPSIEFIDEHRNSFKISPSSKVIEAIFLDLLSLFELPPDYRVYELKFSRGALPIASDVDAMSKWTIAEKIVIRFTVEIPENDFWDKLNELQSSGAVINNVQFFGPSTRHSPVRKSGEKI